MARAKLGTGKGGKSFQDRELAARVRNLTLIEMEKILNQPTLTEMKKQLVLRLAGSVLPRLNEHTGDEGGPIQISGVEIVVRK